MHKTDLNWLHRPRPVNQRRHAGVSAIVTKPQGFISKPPADVTDRPQILTSFWASASTTLA